MSYWRSTHEAMAITIAIAATTHGRAPLIPDAGVAADLVENEGDTAPTAGSPFTLSDEKLAAVHSAARDERGDEGTRAPTAGSRRSAPDTDWLVCHAPSYFASVLVSWIANTTWSPPDWTNSTAICRLSALKKDPGSIGFG